MTITGTGGSHMRDSDAFSWYMERDPLLRSTVVVVNVLDQPPQWDALRARLERASHRVPGFRSRVVHPPLRLATPRWTPLPEIDLDWHVRRQALPDGAGWSALLDLARRKAVTAFDPARPMWEVTVVEGLPEGRAALVMVFHHALTDGIGGVQLAMELYDAERAPGPDDRPVPPAPADDLEGVRLALESLLHDASRAAVTARALPRAGVRVAVGLVRSPVQTVTGALRTVRSVARIVAPALDTMSPLMRDRRLARSFAGIEVPLADLHRAGALSGGHLNDAFLAAVTGGLRRYHERHGAPVHELRVTLPISLRRPGDPPGGNLITLVRVTVPAGLVDAVGRMTAIRELVDAWRDEPALALTQPIAMALNLLPSGVVGSMLKHVDFLASNVPGFPSKVYLAGARVDGYYAFGPTIGASVNVTLMSYADQCCIGISCDSAAVPDPDVLVACVMEGFQEVLDVAGSPDAVRLCLSDVPAPQTA